MRHPKDFIVVAIFLMLGFYFLYNNGHHDKREYKFKDLKDQGIIDGRATDKNSTLHNSLVFPSHVKDFTSKLEYAYSKSGKDLQSLQKEVEDRRSKLKRSPKYGEDQSCAIGDRIPGLIKLFDAWAHMADLFNVRYLLIYGSLVGAERDRNIVPYDLDVDVMIPEDDVPKLLKMVDRHFTVDDNKIHLTIHPEYKTYWRKRTKICCNGEISRGPGWWGTYWGTCWDQCAVPNPLGRLILGHKLHVGIIGYKMIESGSVLKMTCHEEYGFSTEYKWVDMIPKDCEFLGHKTYCPTNPDPMSQAIYGKDWRDPDRTCKNGKWTKISNVPSKYY